MLRRVARQLWVVLGVGSVDRSRSPSGLWLGVEGSKGKQIVYYVNCVLTIVISCTAAPCQICCDWNRRVLGVAMLFISIAGISSGSHYTSCVDSTYFRTATLFKRKSRCLLLRSGVPLIGCILGSVSPFDARCRLLSDIGARVATGQSGSPCPPSLV